MDHDPAQVLNKARQHMADGTLFRSGKRGADLQGMAPHEIATSILTLEEEELADEDDADAMLTREMQEEEGDEAHQAIPEDEQPTRPQLTRAQCCSHTETGRRVIYNLPDTFLDWVSLIPLVKLRYEGSRVPSALHFCFSGGLCVVLVSLLISRLEPFPLSPR